MSKMTSKQAADRAFRDCREGSESSRKAASYLAKQHLIASGLDQSKTAAAMPDVEKHLDELFEKRRSGELAPAKQPPAKRHPAKQPTPPIDEPAVDSPA